MNFSSALILSNTVSDDKIREGYTKKGGGYRAHSAFKLCTGFARAVLIVV